MSIRRAIAPPPNNAAISKYMCVAFGISLIAMGFACESPGNILIGLREYILCEDILLTDYFVIGSIGAAFVNAGLVTLISIALTLWIKTPYTGSTIAMIFLMGGFALFGKNPVNILPFFLGVWLYSRIKGHPMARYTNAALFSTTLAPIVSDLMLHGSFPFIVRMAVALLGGALIGYLIIPLAEHSFSTHMGYSLINYGFAGGLMALIIASSIQAMGGSIETQMIWQEGLPAPVLLYLILLIVALTLAGLWLCGWNPLAYLRIMRHSGRAPTDFVITDGVGAAMVNMGAMGLVSLGYILLIGGDLNGPVVGAILTSIGFGAAGEHPKNTIPVMAGVFIASHIMIPSNTDPGMQLAALFGTALAPISGQFGAHYGVLAGLLHAAVVLATAAPCGGYNLYNNGFAAGLVALVMVSMIQGVSKRWRSAD